MNNNLEFVLSELIKLLNCMDIIPIRVCKSTIAAYGASRVLNTDFDRSFKLY